MFSLRSSSVFISFIILIIVSSGHGSEIIKGKVVLAHSLPYMALLESDKPYCGGVLIDPGWVLTAAHCKNITTVLLGVHSIKEKEKEKKCRQVRKVKRREPHPCYEKTEKVNDLMLLKLDEPVKQTKWVSVLHLNNKVTEPTAGSRCLVAGWGQTNNLSNKMSDVLMSVNVTVIDRVKCNSPEYYNSRPVITNSMICAGSDGQNVADTCKGDSGGPILCNEGLVGITSFGRDCGIKKRPGVYTFLTENHLNWIKKTMKKASVGAPASEPDIWKC